MIRRRVDKGAPGTCPPLFDLKPKIRALASCPLPPLYTVLLNDGGHVAGAPLLTLQHSIRI